MRLTLHTDYALRLLIYLKVSDKTPASVQQVADAYRVSANHLSKVAQRLSHLGWIDAARGRSGGLTLADKVHKLTVGDIVRELETNQRIVECLGPDSTCPIEPACGLKHAIRRATQAFLDVLDGYRLEDIARKPRQLSALLNISTAMLPPSS